VPRDGDFTARLRAQASAPAMVGGAGPRGYFSIIGGWIILKACSDPSRARFLPGTRRRMRRVRLAGAGNV
jgi:hypothetical protein